MPSAEFTIVHNLVADIFTIPNPESADFKIILDKAVDALASGKIIAMPSDTLYGLFGCYQKKQIQNLHLLKKRPLDKPFLLTFPETLTLNSFVDFGDTGLQPYHDLTNKISELWPGRNSIVFRKNPLLEYPPGPTIAIRKPSEKDNIFFYNVLKKLNEPLLAPSLNLHGDQPLDQLDDIVNTFGESVDLIFFDPAFKPSNPSQLWDLTKKPYIRLR